LKKSGEIELEKHRKGPRDGKIVYFPNLTGKLVNKGMSALKQKKFKESLNYFEQLIEMEPDHPQGNIGVVLSLVELGRLQEAKVKCDDILKKDIGEYYDVLQIYISILIQLADYEEVVEILEAVIQEQSLPPQMAENFYQLLYFSRKMAEDDSKDDVTYENMPKSISQNDLDHLAQQLRSDDTKQQWQAVQSIEDPDYPGIREELKKYLTYPDANPSLKTIVLQMLKDGETTDTVHIHKFGKSMDVIPKDLHDIPEGQFYRLVKKIVVHELEQNNPTLLDMAVQIWDHYLFMVYPFQPEPLNEQLWAVGVLEVAHRMNGIEFDSDELQVAFSLKEEAIEQVVEKILEIERMSMKDISLPDDHPN
jgi:tetratricopeptide (TPR) repeat protein